MKYTARNSAQDDLFPPSDMEAAEGKPESVDMAAPTTAEQIAALMKPSAYSGLYAFHKYWGKKPTEPLQFLISKLTSRNELVVDPFLGAGAVAREAAVLGRRFIGGDVNPSAVRLARLFLEPCEAKAYSNALAQLQKEIRPKIDASYTPASAGVSSHLLWRQDEIINVWQRVEGKRSRIERLPTNEDVELSSSFDSYVPKRLRPIRFFHNGRINSVEAMTWQSLFTGRALRNIELLLDRIREFDPAVRRALELTLTSSMGQMSKMVFAITGRGKTKGEVSDRIEVGSWVIGFWRPETHFEINVWNCFDAKAKKVERALVACRDAFANHTVEQVVSREGLVSLNVCDAQTLLESLPARSVKLLITDPPHGDRIPYLELSEMWNATLGEDSLFEEEIVVSGAKGRGKTSDRYNSALGEFFTLAAERIQGDGYLVLFFNSRRDDDWSAIRRIVDNPEMTLLGGFPMEYSARSVVQDNREGGMKTDYILIYVKGKASRASVDLSAIPGWISGWPQ